MPFNWKTPLGFFVALTVQAIASYFTLLSTASILCFLVGLCLLLIAFVRDLANDLKALSVTEIPKKKHEKLMEDFRKSIKRYSQVKELRSSSCPYGIQMNNHIFMLFFFKVCRRIQRAL